MQVGGSRWLRATYVVGLGCDRGEHSVLAAHRHVAAGRGGLERRGNDSEGARAGLRLRPPPPRAVGAASEASAGGSGANH
jgi:hypothetical protein